MELVNLLEYYWSCFLEMQFYHQCMVISSFLGLSVASIGLFIAFPQYLRSQRRTREEKIAEEFNHLATIVTKARRRLNELPNISPQKLSPTEAEDLWKHYNIDYSKLESTEIKPAKRKNKVVLGLLDVLGDLEDFSIRVNEKSINFKMVVKSSGKLLVKYFNELEEFIRLIQEKEGSKTYFAEFEYLVDRLRKYRVVSRRTIIGRKKLIVVRKWWLTNLIFRDSNNETNQDQIEQSESKPIEECLKQGQSKVWKFVHKQDYSYKSRHLQGRYCDYDWLRIDKDGTITVKGSFNDCRGYAWDGCTPKFNWIHITWGNFDGRLKKFERGDYKPYTYYASMIHDALYQYKRCAPITRYEADLIFYDLLKESRYMWAPLYFLGVLLFGWIFTGWKYKSKKHIPIEE